MSSDTIRVRVQSPFIWESSPTDVSLPSREEGTVVQSPFIWESSPTGTYRYHWPYGVQSPFIWESSPTGTS